MKKYIVLFFSILSQLCIGGIYAWSVLVGPLQAEHSISKARAGLIAAGFGCGAMATVKIAETMLSLEFLFLNYCIQK
jgi:hypothetical protein